MLTITIPEGELWDERNEEFVYTSSRKLQLEHSLVSISKWEAKWHKPFLGSKDRTDEELLDYIRCMTINKDVDDYVYYGLTKENLKRIESYIDDPHTATTFYNFGSTNNKIKSETITSELIYYWMIIFQIPVEFQKWHLNRLITLIKLCEIKNSPGKKMSPKEIMTQNAALNAARRKKYNTKG